MFISSWFWEWHFVCGNTLHTGPTMGMGILHPCAQAGRADCIKAVAVTPRPDGCTFWAVVLGAQTSMPEKCKLNTICEFSVCSVRAITRREAWTGCSEWRLG